MDPQCREFPSLIVIMLSLVPSLRTQKNRACIRFSLVSLSFFSSPHAGTLALLKWNFAEYESRLY